MRLSTRECRRLVAPRAETVRAQQALDATADLANRLAAVEASDGAAPPYDRVDYERGWAIFDKMLTRDATGVDSLIGDLTQEDAQRAVAMLMRAQWVALVTEFGTDGAETRVALTFAAIEARVTAGESL